MKGREGEGSPREGTVSECDQRQYVKWKITLRCLQGGEGERKSPPVGVFTSGPPGAGLVYLWYKGAEGGAGAR